MPQPLATLAQLKQYLDLTSAVDEALLWNVLERASAIIKAETGIDFTLSATGIKTVYGTGTDFLELPAHVAGSITTITTPTGITVPTWVEADGMLRVTRNGQVYGALSDMAWWWQSHYSGWVYGVPYVITASWGYERVPYDIVECCLELAATIYRRRSTGFANTVGVTGETVYEGAYPALMKRIISLYKIASPKLGAG